MKRICFILGGMLFSCICFSQDTIPAVKEAKNQFAIIASGHYKYFIGNRYIEPTPAKPGDSFYKHQYEGFTKIPTGGFYAGALWIHKMRSHWYLTLGLIVSYRKNVFEKEKVFVGERIHRYNYTYYSLEIPLLLLYKFNKMNFFAGVHLPIFTFYKASYTYWIWDNYPYQVSEKEKTLYGLAMPPLSIPSLFPSIEIQFTPWDVTITPPAMDIYYAIPVIFATFKVAYDCQIKNKLITPFIGIDLGLQKNIYLQGGVILPLKRPTHKSNTSTLNSQL